MTYNIYTRLMDEAANYTDVDLFIAERGWQDWMDAEPSAEHVATMLRKIYDLSRMSTGDIRSLAGMSQAQTAVFLGVPRRTIENWDAGSRSCPEYTRRMIAWALASRW